MSNIDLKVFNSLKDLVTDDDPDFLQNFTALFLQSTLERMKKVEDALSRADSETIQKEAHAMKSGAANIGSIELSNLCSKLECSGRESNLSESNRLYLLIKSSYALSRQELEVLIKLK